VTKSSPPEVLVNAVYQVAARRQVISPDIAPELALALIDRPRERLAELAPREFEILRLLLDGCSADEIGVRLSISPRRCRTATTRSRASWACAATSS
jgi:DNA-binding NarL/FixJ family response regulator